MYSIALFCSLVLTVTAIPISPPPLVTIIPQEGNDTTSSHHQTAKICRGTILDAHTIVTAASCVERQGVEYFVHGPARSEGVRIYNISIHPEYPGELNGTSTADLALLFMETPLLVGDSGVDLPSDIYNPFLNPSYLDTATGFQQLLLFDHDHCLSEHSDKLYAQAICNTAPGSPVLQVNHNRTILVGLVSSIPEPCNSTECRLQLTFTSHYASWLSRGDSPSVKLPHVPATVIFSFLKLLAVVSSLGGVSFAFCCVMFLISN